MAADDEIQAFMQVMDGMKRLSASRAAETIANELQALRKRDLDNTTLINRHTEDRYDLLQKFKAATAKTQALEAEVKGLRNQLTNAEADRDEMEKKAKERWQDLKIKTDALTHLEQFRVVLKADSPDVKTRWPELWKAVEKLATDFFSADLDPETLRAAHDWVPVTSHQSTRAFPAPPTNTSEAKQMRIIAVESTIAAILTRHVFQPVGLDTGFATALSHLAHTSPDKESFYRSSHLAVLDSLAEYRLTVANRAVNDAVAEILGSVSRVVPAARMQKFQDQLGKVCSEAYGAWQVFQQYGERYEVDMDGDVESYDPVPLWQSSPAETPKTNEAGKTPSPGPVQNGKRAERAERVTPWTTLVTPVWPLLKVVSAGGAVPRMSGLALFPDQTRAAEEQVMRANRRASRGGGKKEERKSGSRPVSLGAILQSSPKSP